MGLHVAAQTGGLSYVSLSLYLVTLFLCTVPDRNSYLYCDPGLCLIVLQYTVSHVDLNSATGLEAKIRFFLF